jgi:hypothetical protein
MNKFRVLILTLISITCVSVYAQNSKNEISFGIGFESWRDIRESFQEPFTSIFSFGFIKNETVSNTETFTLNYKNYLTANTTIGATLNYQKFKNQLLFLDEPTSIIETRYYTLMGRGDYYYLRSEIIKLYSGVAVGAMLGHESGESIDSKNELYFAFQANFFGLRVGKNLAGFFELGFGFNGIINMGLAYSF